MRIIPLVLLAIGCGSLGRPPSGPSPHPDLGMGSMPTADLSSPAGPTGGASFDDQCQGQATTLGGTVLAPNGHDPIANAFVYVPRSTGSFPATVSCELCTQPVDSVLATTVSKPDGSFSLDIGSLPASATVQLTVNKGRFRHTSTVTLTPCMPNNLTVAETSLPGKPLAGSDDIPKIAVATGNQDQLDTVLTAMGLDQTQGFDCFEGRVKPSSGTPKALTTPCGKRGTLGYVEDLLSDETKLEGYNLVFLSCVPGKFKSLSAAQQTTIVANLRTWTQKGGRLFATDNSYDYLAQAFPSDATFLNGDGTVDAANVGVGGSTSAPAKYNGKVNDPALVAWLVAVGALQSGSSSLELDGYLNKWSVVASVPSSTVDVVDATNAQAYSGASPSPSPGPAASYPQSIKFDIATPNGDACGRAIYTSYHTLLSTTSSTDPTVQLSPQERILEYLMFEADACVGPVS